MTDSTATLVFGWHFNKSSFKNIDLWSDKYLPYTEGHEGINYSLILRETGDIIFGHPIAELNVYQEDVKKITVNIDTDIIEAFNNLFPGVILEEPPRILFFNDIS